MLIAGTLMVLWNIYCWQFPFFWDNVLNAKIAHWYLDTGFSQLTVPEGLDAGHPPFFSLYLAVVWRLTGGASLAIAHVAMLPFLLLLLVQYYKLAVRLLPENGKLWALAFLVCEPTFLAQSSMLTPDIALVSLFLLCLNALMDGRRGLQAVAMTLMAAVTFRGILAVPAVFLVDVGLAWFSGLRKPNWLKLWPYLPVGFLTLLWFWIHYQAVGWLLTPPPETYGAHRKIIGLSAMLRNLGIIGWRFLDFGRVSMWLFVLTASLLTWRRQNHFPLALKKSILLFLLPTTLFSLIFIPFSNPIGMRYFLVCYLLLGLIGVAFLVKINATKIRTLIGSAICLTMLSGHFWVYPDHIAKSWDGSLAHVTYFKLKKEVDDFLLTSADYPSQYCSDFPLLSSSENTRIESNPISSFSDKNQFPSLKSCQYVLYSNISNGFSEVEMRILQNHSYFHLVKTWKSGGVKIILYKKVISVS